MMIDCQDIHNRAINNNELNSLLNHINLVCQCCLLQCLHKSLHQSNESLILHYNITRSKLCLEHNMILKFQLKSS